MANREQRDDLGGDSLRSAFYEEAGKMLGMLLRQRLDQSLFSGNSMPALGSRRIDMFEDCLVNTCRVDHKTVKAETSFFHTQGSLYYGLIHSPMTLIPVGLTASQLLEDGESITSIKRFSWSQLCFTNQTLIASREPIMRDSAQEELCTFRGVLQTSFGSNIYIKAHSNGEPVSFMSNKELFGRSLICCCHDCHKTVKGSSEHYFGSLLGPEVVKIMLKKQPGFSMGLFLETYSEIGNFLLERDYIEGHDGPSVIARVRDVNLVDSENLDMLRGGVKVVVGEPLEVLTQNMHRVTPIKVSFLDSSGKYTLMEGSFDLASPTNTSMVNEYFERERLRAMMRCQL